MTNMALLNNVEHHDLRVISGHGPEYGDSINLTPVFPTEFAEAQRDYPILFRKGEDGQYSAVALLGLDKGENLFLTDEGWQGRYIPAIHQRGPFVIGRQNQEIDGETRQEPVIFVDLEDSRVSRSDGHPLFLKHGGNSPYLQHVSHVLRVINKGAEIARPMFAAFEAADLIEPASLEIRLDEHTVYNVPDIYSINEQKLAALEGATLENLHKSGFLRAAYLVLASLPNVSRLIALKNTKRANDS
jgi:hypothetical protein